MTSITNYNVAFY